MIELQPDPAPGPIRLQHGGVDDLDDVMHIMTAAFPPCFGEGWTRSQCAGILPMAGVKLTIARDSRRPVAFSLMRIVADEAELLLIAVDPAEQGKGIGGILLDHFVETGSAFGASRLHLEVRDGNPAVVLYEKAGFVAAGRRRGYYRGPEGKHYDALTLVFDESK